MNIDRQVKRYLPRTLLGRALLILASPLVLMQFISAYVFYERHWDTMARRLSDAVAGDIAIVADQLSPGMTTTRRLKIFDRAYLYFRFRLIFHRGARLAPQPSLGWFDWIENTLVEALAGHLHQDFRVTTIGWGREIHVDLQLEDGTLEVRVPHKRLFSSTTYIFILWMVGSSFVLVAIAAVFMRNQLRPIRRLAEAADGFGKGRDDPKFKPEGAVEVRQAAAAFLNMRDRIKRQIRQRTEMLAGVSHDLRTPLTRMKLQMAMMGDDDALCELRSDVTEMEHMIEGYLAFARGEGTEVAHETDIGLLLEDVVYNARREHLNVSITFSPLDVDRTMMVRSNALRRALSNLIANACRYGTKVRIQSNNRTRFIDILIEDNGPGIPEDMREQAFRPFQRLDDSRNLDTGGTGLGMTIARDVVRSHGGDITLSTAEPLGGLKVIVRIPI